METEIRPTDTIINEYSPFPVLKRDGRFYSVNVIRPLPERNKAPYLRPRQYLEIRYELDRRVYFVQNHLNPDRLGVEFDDNGYIAGRYG